jgi:hypothetical protein
MYEKNQEGNSQTVPYFIIWQALIWARFTLISPFLFLLTMITFYTLGYRDWVLLFDIIMVMGGAVIIVWWFWVVYTIASIAYMVEKSSGRLRDVLTDIKSMKKEIQSFDTPLKNKLAKNTDI